MTQSAFNYGVVLYQLGIQRPSVETADEEVTRAPELGKIFRNPTISDKKKHRIIERIFPPELHHFLKYVSDDRKFDQIKEIFAAYKIHSDQQNGIVTAVLLYFTPPTMEQQEKIKRFVRQKYQCKEVKLLLKVDPSLLGGFIIRVGSFEYDRSLRGRFTKMKRRMTRRN